MLEAWWVVKETAREKGRSFGYAFFFAVLSLASSDILGSSVEYPSLRTTEKISHAERPLFVIGDKYSFNNPEITWEVTAVHGQRVYWRSASGDEQVTSTNPLLPAFAWQSKRRGSGQRIISNKTGDIFPLKIGARMTFRSTVVPINLRSDGNLNGPVMLWVKSALPCPLVHLIVFELNVDVEVRANSYFIMCRRLDTMRAWKLLAQMVRIR